MSRIFFYRSVELFIIFYHPTILYYTVQILRCLYYQRDSFFYCTTSPIENAIRTFFLLLIFFFFEHTSRHELNTRLILNRFPNNRWCFHCFQIVFVDDGNRLAHNQWSLPEWYARSSIVINNPLHPKNLYFSIAIW